MLTATVDGLKLKAKRERSGLTVKTFVPKVAAELGKSVHPSTIEKIETGDRQPSSELYAAICRALRCEWEDLLKATSGWTCTRCEAVVTGSRHACAAVKQAS